MISLSYYTSLLLQHTTDPFLLACINLKPFHLNQVSVFPKSMGLLIAKLREKMGKKEVKEEIKEGKQVSQHQGPQLL